MAVWKMVVTITAIVLVFATAVGIGVGLSFSRTSSPQQGDYNVGVGIADMTGPPVEINFMGYAELSQSGEGIHLRQFSRAFVFEKDGSRVVYVSTDLQSVGFPVRKQVVTNLRELYGDLYSERNVIIAGTHTHSTPGGYLVDFLLDVSILGFVQESFDAYVSGITESIVRAHESITPARLFYAETKVRNIHVNRSPNSYDNNPPEEKARFTQNTDDTLYQLRITNRDEERLVGVINWFAVHPTSMNMTNKLISSDNLGYASILMEEYLNPDNLAGQPDVVCAFASANLGDISPNTAGARCEFSGNECDNQFTVCNFGERCFASGPGNDMFESTKIIATTIVEGAKELLNTTGIELTESIRVMHQFVNMPEEVVARYDPISETFNENDLVKGCVPAMGYSFASGTMDGANILNITQGTLTGNPLLDSVRDLLGEPTDEDIECHSPKPILLATGRSSFPYEWHPTVVSASVLWLGGLTVVAVPGELSTMAGRRLRSVVTNVLEAHGKRPMVVLSGLANEYIHYITTFEEYQIQRYEGASTIYGPHTLEIFLNKFQHLTSSLLEDTTVEPGPTPIDNRENTISLVLPVVFDSSPLGRDFGDCIVQPATTAQPRDTVTATFVSGNPRNNLQHGTGYLTIERQDDDQWTVVATDASWETKFYWTRTSTIVGTSNVRIEWTVPENVSPGVYRFRHNGHYKPIFGNPIAYEGISNTVQIV